MAWKTVVLKVLSEYRNKDGDLKSKFEITRPESDDGKHFAPGLQKTSFYKKDGVETRGYAQALTKYDLKWVREHFDEIDIALAPPATEEAKPTAKVTTDAVEDVPF